MRVGLFSYPYYGGAGGRGDFVSLLASRTGSIILTCRRWGLPGVWGDSSGRMQGGSASGGKGSLLIPAPFLAGELTADSGNLQILRQSGG